jgi:hypothetical protein
MTRRRMRQDQSVVVSQMEVGFGGNLFLRIKHDLVNRYLSVTDFGKASRH